MKGIKGQVDEGGVRVPALIRWSGKIESGRKINQPLAHIDWYPTLTGLCGLDPVMYKPVDGMDFSAQILGRMAEFPDRTLFTHVATDTIRWLVESNTARTFDLYLSYTCPPSDLGSVIEVQIEETSLQDTISLAFDPPWLPSPDRVKRKEAYEKEWASMLLGTIYIPAGRNWIRMVPVTIRYQQVAEVNALELRLNL